MCLAVPAKILEIKGEKALADFGGVRREIITNLLDQVKVGDYVIVHTGFAIEILDEKEAVETLQLWKEILQYSEPVHS
ncbi:MAG: HypC/HybG/HupF family hydrogenase formation chaperone [archaeon]